MSYVLNRDFLIEVQKGNVAKHSMVHKFGRNDAIPSGSWEFLWQLSAAHTYRSSAATMRIKAGGDAADTAAGAGAQEVTIQGIDSNLAEVSEAIATNGALASTATTASFWRVHRAWVSASGTYGAANTAAVTIEDSGGSADMIQITAGEGQSQYGGFTIPTGYTGYLLSVTLTADSAKAADFRMFTRENFNDTSAPVSAPRLKLYWDGVKGVLPYRPVGPELSLAALTDVWFEGQGSSATEASVDFEILMVQD